MLANRFPALTYRNFRIFWVGQFVSLIGTWMQSTVQPYLAYRITNQPIFLGAIGFAAALPSLLFILPAGVLVERINKRKLVIAMQVIMMLQAFTLAFLVLNNRITIWQILVLAFILGTANAVEITARQAMLIELVDREALPNAIALNSAIFNAARVIGPSISAPFLILLKNAGEGWAFFANGLSFIFVIIGLMIIRTRPLLLDKVHHSTGIQEFREGQNFIRQNKIVLFLILMVTIPSFWGFPIIQQIPVFAKDVLKGLHDVAADVATRNSLIVTFQGIGALVAALTLAVFSTIRRKGILLTIGQIVYAIGIIGLGLSRTLWLSLLSIFLVGWGTVTLLALTNTLIQLNVPDQLRGRVVSTYLWVLNGVAPFGSLFLGWLVQQYNAPTAALVGGSVCLVAYILFHIKVPMVRRV